MIDLKMHGENMKLHSWS